MSYEIEIGNPQAALHLKFTVDGPDDDALEGKVADALGVLRRSGQAWTDWTREHETDEEREVRLMLEENEKLKKRVLAKQNADMREMLNGSA